VAAPQKIKARIKSIIKFKYGVTLFKLIPERKCKFKPGQFLHFAMDNYDPSFNWPDSRVFSIANSPLSYESIDILVAPKGYFTKKMILELKENDEVWIKLPFGSFNFNDSANSNCVLIAGGTGISPFVSFLEYSLSEKLNLNSLVLYYGVRDIDLIIYKDLLNKCLQTLKNFEYKIYIENYNTGGDKRMISGMLPVTEIVDDTGNLLNPVYYLSGPKGMIGAFEKEMKKNSIPEQNIFYDKWE
jgi:NAD(P)H-flavin reductase